jgi:hypothetical protein
LLITFFLAVHQNNNCLLITFFLAIHQNNNCLCKWPKVHYGAMVKSQCRVIITCP